MCIALNNTVAPAITDPTVQVQLAMAISVLQTTAVRSGNELAWMQEERDAIEETARRSLEALPDATALRGADDVRRRQDRTACISTTPRPTTRGQRGAVVRHRGCVRVRATPTTSPRSAA